MPKYSDFQAAIFDVDDTLLTNHPNGRIVGLHEESRLRAIHAIGRQRGITVLQTLNAEDNYAAFRDAPVHSLEGAVWNILLMSGLANGDVIDFENSLLKEIVALKDRLHENVLRQLGEEVPGAAAFVRKLARHGFSERLAIASSAVHRDAVLSLEIIGLADFFPPDRIITKKHFMHTKPHPESYNLAFASLKLAGVPREKVLAFEDDPRGIMSAKAAGLYTCAITTRYSKKELAALEIAPDLIANSYPEFEALLGLA